MKLYTYKNQLGRFFDEFNKVNIPFTEIRAKLPAGGVVGKDGANGNVFDTMQVNFEQLKEAIVTLKSLLEEDEKKNTNEAEAFFSGTFRPLLNNLYKEQTNFKTFTETNKSILSGPQTMAIYSMFTAATAGMSTCKYIDDQNQKSVSDVKLDAYEEQLENLFKMVNDLNISFTGLKAQLPSGRIVEKDGEEKGNFFDTMQDNLDQLKEAAANLKHLMEEDDKHKTNKAADFFFETFKTLLEDIKDEQENFQAFLAEKDYDELSIPGMRDVYKVFMAANSGLGLCHHINALNEMFKADSAKYEYNKAHDEYKEAKKAFIEKYKGQDVKKLLEDLERLFSDEMLKKSEYYSAHDKAVNAEEKSKTEIPELENAIKAADNNISNTEIAIKSYDEKIKIINSYKDKLEAAETQHRALNEKLEGDLANKRTALETLKSAYGTKANEYLNSSLKLNNAMLENSDMKDYIDNQMKLAECNILYPFLNDEYTGVQDTTKYNDLNPEAQAIIAKHVENVDKNPTVAQIFEMIAAKMPELVARSMNETNESVKLAIQEYAERAREVILKEKDINQMEKVVAEAELQVQKNKEAYGNTINEQYKDFVAAGVIKEKTNSNTADKIGTPEKFGVYLDNIKQRYAELSTKAARSKDLSINTKNELNNKLTAIKDEIKTLREREETLDREVSQMHSERDTKKSIEDDVRKLESLYRKSQKQRKAAVDAYAAYKNSIEKGELASVKDAATKLFARVGDAATGHKNSTEFQKLEDALKKLKDAEPVDRADKIGKLQEIKQLAETYKQAKLDQHLHWIPSTLRKTRLQFADDVIAAAKERIERLEEFDGTELDTLETLFGENSKNKAKVEKYAKNKEEKAFAKALSKKTLAQSEQKQESAPKEEIKEENTEEMGDKSL